MNAVLLIGIPASGKSSFYRECFAETHVRINRDMLRTVHREKELLDWCLRHGQSCVSDNTNTTREARHWFLQRCAESGVRVDGYYFESKLAVCLERNAGRAGVARIPDAGVRDHHARLEIPTIEEGLASLQYVHLDLEGFVVLPWNREI